MILTGKCKEKFEKWYFENHCSSNIKFEDLLPYHIYDVFGWLYKQSLTIQNALIIEFFDSIGVYIEIHYSSFLGNRFICIVNTNENHKVTSFQNNRHQAIKKAIKKANDLYNSRYENV